MLHSSISLPAKRREFTPCFSQCSPDVHSYDFFVIDTSSVYLKNNLMADMDQNLGDVSSFIVDREIELLDGLHAVLDDSITDLLAAHTALCQLDCLMAFARAATLYDLRREFLVQAYSEAIRALTSFAAVLFVLRHLRPDSRRGAVSTISKTDKRCPIIDASHAQRQVPNDLELRGGRGVAHDRDEARARPIEARDGSHEDLEPPPSIETASLPPLQASASAVDKFSVMELVRQKLSPAAGGTSCLLEPVRAVSSLLPMPSWASLTKDESLSSEGSSFTRELGRLHRAMSMATEKSLVILDEVGRECRSDGESSRCEAGQKGKAWSIEHPCDTSCADGAGLFIATIYDFCSAGQSVLSSYPRLIIFVSAIERHFPADLPIERAHMQTILLPTLVEAFKSLTYLYRLRPGFAGASHACHCARLCGVPESVVELAEHICRVGLRAWHKSEADQDEAIVRRLLQLDLGNDEDEQQQQPAMEDNEAIRLLELVLRPEEGAGSTQG
ncbi:hypothetical protein L1887_54492 [Cichorium endivia]|nr:hypothetical protein L1887_54492 [Cichorium endivia]